ncbi:MAG: vitamin K epoxide reductase family protein [Gemmatimonadota bacterium]|nr:vitamin K epoxide reductase family protein [Gemmatimonadota bacterium]
MRYRGVALLALAGLFVSLYLWLYHLGFYGALICGAGSCDVVQTSRWARFLGQPVAAWGVAWYVVVLGTALALQAGRWETGGRGVLAAAAWAGVAFSAYLTALELFVIHAICMWCVISAGLATGIFLLTAPWGRKRRSAA